MFAIIWDIMSIICKGIAFCILISCIFCGILVLMIESHKESKKKREKLIGSVPRNAPITGISNTCQTLYDSLNTCQTIQTQGIATSMTQQLNQIDTTFKKSQDP